MDTGSHLLFGVSLAGLACLEPAVVQNPDLAHAILAGTLIGSHAPDFDTLARLKGYATYLRVHRGITHSLPALFIWPVLISVPLAAMFGVWEHLISLYLWTFAAVVFHVFLDLFNVYGVQCFRPLSAKWFHLDTLCLYEPFLFALHTLGILVWLFVWGGSGGSHIGEMFGLIYGASFFYIAIRASQRKRLIESVKNELKLSDAICHLIPSLSWFHWQFVVEGDMRFYLGEIREGRIQVQEEYSKAEYTNADTHPIVQATMGTDGVRAFLHFAQRIHVSWSEKSDGYEVQWRDVRFWYKRKLSFGVNVHLDRDMNVVSDTLGWDKKAWDPPYV
ncbi:metal-dependent hydrolase [Paenibacillus alba]|uniref:Metal-dependent hydrolase n=1 Tax=Paenibacillus alba TaxID=1197127 RepID=A0ABU6G2I4_9BACL|nr:metal-dependent hydrolase [Paenibacillus alba]MEC0228379.1 metal-dependent hydrolase [Paenibacillus alba]NQX64689.1 metal-dependent hydrolase [Paenibacillus alba]